MSMSYKVRQIGDITVLDLSGRISLGEALAFGADSRALLHEVVRDRLASGSRKILFNLRDVSYIDSSGLGQMVGCYTTVCSLGGELRVCEPSPRVKDLLNMTKMASVFDVRQDEASALQAFAQQKGTTAA